MNLHQRTGTRSGFATVGALVATTLLVAVAAAIWWIAFNASLEARRAHASTQAELAARAALRVAAVAPSLPYDLPLGGTRPAGSVGVAPGVSSRVDLERVGREWFVVRAEGIHERPPARRKIGYAAWALHPTARLADAGAVVSSGGRVIQDAASGVRANAMNAPPLGWATECASVLSAADSAVPGGTLAAVAPDTTPAVRLGRVDAAWLSANADLQVNGIVSPAPASGVGGCLGLSPANWGDPGGVGPCSNYRPIIASDDDLVVQGGIGQGTLVVRGNLSLVGGARFWGVVLVAGSLSLGEGSRVTGLVRVGGDVGLRESTIVGSSCPTLLALANPKLAVSQPIRGGWVNPL